MDDKDRMRLREVASRMDRRQLLRWGSALGGALLAAPVLGGHAFAQDAVDQDVEEELVFAAGGGETQETFETKIFPPFAEKYGNKVKLTYIAGQASDTLAKLRTQRNSPTIDVAWLAGASTYQAIDEDLVAELDMSLVPNYALIPESVGRETTVAPICIAVCQLLYNPEVFEQNGWEPPKGWLDMWDPKFAGHVMLPSISLSIGVAFLAEIARELTGDFKNFDQAFDKIKELRPNMLDFYTSSGIQETAYRQGEQWVGILSGQRAWQLQQSGSPIGFVAPENGLVGYQTWAGIAKGAPHPKVAHAWINYLMSTEGQNTVMLGTGYTPVNPQVVVPDENRKFFPDISTVFVPDWRYLSTQLPDLVKRWNQEIER